MRSFVFPILPRFFLSVFRLSTGWSVILFRFFLLVPGLKYKIFPWLVIPTYLYLIFVRAVVWALWSCIFAVCRFALGCFPIDAGHMVLDAS